MRRADWRDSFGASAGWEAEAAIRDERARTDMRDTARSNSRPQRLLSRLPQCEPTPAGEQEAAEICRALLSFMTRRSAADAARCRRSVGALGVGALVALLRSSNTAVVEAAARALQGLAFENGDAVQAVSKAGVVPLLQAILGAERPPPCCEAEWWRVQLSAVGLATNLTLSDLDTAAAMTEAGVARSVGALVVSPGAGGAELRRAACAALTNLTWAATHLQGALLVEACGWPGLLPALLEMLLPGAGEEEQEAAAALLWSLLRGRGEAVRRFVAGGGTERAVPLMTGARSERLRVCCTALLAMLGVGTPNTTGGGVVLASGSWQSKRGGPNRGSLPTTAVGGSAASSAGRAPERRAAAAQPAAPAAHCHPLGAHSASQLSGRPF